jgi:hypothetical protein
LSWRVARNGSESVRCTLLHGAFAVLSHASRGHGEPTCRVLTRGLQVRFPRAGSLYERCLGPAPGLLARRGPIRRPSQRGRKSPRASNPGAGPNGLALTLGRPRVGYCWCGLRRVGRCRRVCAAVGADG